MYTWNRSPETETEEALYKRILFISKETQILPLQKHTINDKLSGLQDSM